MAQIPWWSTFQLEKSSKASTISEIYKFVDRSLCEAREVEELGAKHLMSLLQSADLHFTVDPLDVDGDSISESMEDVLRHDNPKHAVDASDRITFWSEQLMQMSLMMAERLVTYRQATNPSKVLTASLRRFVNGLRGFVLMHGPHLPPADDLKWLDLITRITNDRDIVQVEKLGFQRLYIRAMTSPLCLLEATGDGIADDLRKHRLTRKPESAAAIIDLQDGEIATLRRLRSKLESTIDRHHPSGGQTLLHASPTHLFSAKTYGEANALVDAVIAGSAQEHTHLVMLLQKKFELMALQEVAQILRSATTCYQKIGTMLESSKNWNIRCVGIVEHITELYWLQRRSFNMAHGNVEVNIADFIAYLKTLKDLGKSNADMWSPSLFKLQEMLQTGRLPMESIHFVYDTLLLPKYTDAAAAAQFWPSPGVGPGPPSIAQTLEPLLVSLTPTVTKGPTSPAPPVIRPTIPTSTPGSGFAELKNSATYTAVLTKREEVRALVRQTIQAAARVERNASRLDVEMGKFAELILLPFLNPIRVQWNTAVPVYLKSMTRDHDDKTIFDDAVNHLSESQGRALRTDAPKSFDRAAASLSSSSLFVIQILKAFRLFMQIGAAFVAQKVFNESYVRKVFSEGRDPPPLQSMLFLMLSIDATAHLMLVLILVLSSFAFKTDTNTYMVDDIFLADLLIEFAMSSLVLIILGMMVADIMRRKRYFQYADQGQVVSTAYRSALLYICVINFVVPFSVLIS